MKWLNHLKDEPGVYAIANIVSGRIYVGSSFSLLKRAKRHEAALRKAAHYNCKLQADYSKHGPNSFCFIAVEYCKNEVKLSSEQFWIDELVSYDQSGYNLNRKAVLTSQEGLLKAAASRRGRPCKEETKAKISLANRGRIGTKHTEEFIANLIKRHTGAKRSELAKQRMRDAHARRKARCRDREQE